jgi:hypothetical protein
MSNAISGRGRGEVQKYPIQGIFFDFKNHFLTYELVLVPPTQLTLTKRLLHSFLFTAFFLLASQLSAQTVFITKTGAKYHKESCRYAKTGWASDLVAAKKRGLTACLVCKPSSTETGEAKPFTLSAGPKNVEARKETKPAQVTSTQCKATTKAGPRCSRKAAAGSSFCWQHEE